MVTINIVPKKYENQILRISEQKSSVGIFIFG